MVKSLTYMFTFAFITLSSVDGMAGQISVINPSSGSEASGVVTISPQPSTPQGGSGQPNSNSSSFSNGESYKSTKYIIYKNFFQTVDFSEFTKDQLLFAQSNFLEILAADGFGRDLKMLIKEQLSLVKKEIELE